MSSITFYCLCGKKLKARASSAGKRTQCPQCGEPVGIPISSRPVAPPTSRKEAVDAVLGGAVRDEGREESAALVDDMLARTESQPAPGIRDTTEPARDDAKTADSISSEQPGVTRRPDRKRKSPTQPQASSEPDAPVPYFMDDAPPPPPRKIRRRRSKQKKTDSDGSTTGDDTTRGLPAGTSPGDAAEAASQSLADSPEDGLQLRNRPKWYRLISRGDDYRGPSAIHEIVGFTLGNAPLVMMIAVLLALTLGAGAIQLPAAMQNSRDPLAVLVIVAIGFVVGAAHACSYFNQTILNAALHQGKAIDLDPVRTAKTSFAWVSAVLAGPALPAGGTFLYWLRIGLDEPVDWIIFGELIWLTFFWLTASLLSYGIDVELKAMLPHRAFRKATLIPRAVAICSAFAAFLCAGTIAGVWIALVEIHENPVGGFSMLALAFLLAVSLGGVLAKSLGRSARGLIPHEKKQSDASAKEFERELASQS